MELVMQAKISRVHGFGYQPKKGPKRSKKSQICIWRTLDNLFVAKEIFSKLKLKWNITSFNLKPYTQKFDEFKVPY